MSIEFHNSTNPKRCPRGVALSFALVLGSGASLLAQADSRLNFNLFGEARGTLRDTNPSVGSGFSLGKFGLLATGQITDQWSALAEVIVEYDPDLKTERTNIERLFLLYTYSDALSAGMGKRNSPFGHWNTAYYHSAPVFRPTIEQPLIVQPAGDGMGMNLVMDETGAWVSGRATGPRRLAYTLLIANGTDAGPSASNGASHKAVTAHGEATLVGPVTLGASYRKDKVPASDGTGGMAPGQVSLNTDVTSSGLDLRVEHAAFTCMAEYRRIREKDAVGTASNSGWFLYAGAPWGDWTPYLLLQGTQIDAQSRIYSGVATSLRQQTLGVKYAFEASFNVKVEASNLKRVELDRTDRRLAMALAFGF